MVLWDAVFDEVAQNFPDVTTERVLVDAMTARMVAHPTSIDTVVATNLHADILSDLAAALTGSLGLAPTANLDPDRRFPSMFEPIHGSGHDIAGQGRANPVGALWSAALMLSHLGESAAGDRLVRAIERALAYGVRTPDLGGNAGTRDMAEAVKRALLQGADQGSRS
jgi:tartrate dehydrogenase/decarboxylase/D-malate dehydrogenase